MMSMIILNTNIGLKQEKNESNNILSNLPCLQNMIRWINQQNMHVQIHPAQTMK